MTKRELQAREKEMHTEGKEEERQRATEIEAHMIPPHYKIVIFQMGKNLPAVLSTSCMNMMLLSQAPRSPA